MDKYREYELYLHYRADYKLKLSFKEYKKNHKEKAEEWACKKRIAWVRGNFKKLGITPNE